MDLYSRQIIKISLPSIVSNITVPLLGLVDVAIVGNLDSAVYIGAISVGGTLFNLIYWLFAFLRMGTTAFTSNAYGRSDFKDVSLQLCRSCVFSLTAAFLLLVFQKPIINLALIIIGASADVAEYARLYFSIVIWGAPAVLTSYALNGWLVGVQNTRIPMLVSIFQNVTNILVSLYLVFGLGLSIVGVATGTVVAQYLGILLELLLIRSKYRGRIKMQDVVSRVFQLSQFLSFLRVNTDILFRTLCIISVTLFFTSASARGGDTLLAANTLLMQFFIVFSYFTDGLANAAEALCGKYYGASDYSSFMKVLRKLFLFGIVLSALFTFTYWLVREPFINILTNNHEVAACAVDYSYWIVLVPFCSIVAFVFDGVFIGLIATRQMFVSMLFAASAFFLTYYAGMKMNTDLGMVLWLAFLLYLFVRGLLLSFFFIVRHKSLTL